MLSILIVNWNTKEHLRRCLASIREHAPSEPWEVIVVDNASPDGSADLVKDEFPWVRLIACMKNIGYAAGNNRAFGAAEGDHLLTLNPDTEFFDDSLQRAVETMSGRADAGALAGKLLNPDRTVQMSLRGFPRPLAIICDALGLGKLFSRNRFFGAYRQMWFDYSKAAEVEQPMGTFVLYRREALDQVGLMDEQFPIFFNDVDLLYRIRKKGWKILYTPEVQLIHHAGASTRQVRKAMIWESHRSLIRYYRKWYARWWNLPALFLFDMIVWFAAWVRARGWHAGFRP
ncbi:MAG: glycosyltransferase family 2 protein [Armatimonadetes bacterium]|nr:glycosyltransferase family 2 protein [Armatimonadota bacterium]